MDARGASSHGVQVEFKFMAISNELSSEIASALLSKKERSPEELNDLKNILFEVHSTLQSLTKAALRERTDIRPSAKAAANEP